MRRADALKSGEAEAPAAGPAFEFESLDLTPAADARPAAEAPAAFEVMPAPHIEPAEELEDWERPAEAIPAALSEPEVGVAPVIETVEAAPAAFALEMQPASQPEEEPDVAIGGISLSGALFAIYIDEAEQHVGAMEREMSAIEPSDDAVRPTSCAGAHSGQQRAHRRFEARADTASALEMARRGVEVVPFRPRPSPHAPWRRPDHAWSFSADARTLSAYA